MSVLQLKYTRLATEDDRFWQLDLWAEFFKADTWEVIHTLAEKNPYIASAAQIYRVTEEDYIRNWREAREEGEKTQRTIELLHQMELQQVNDELQQKDKALQQVNDELQRVNNELQQVKDEIARRRAELEALKNNEM